MKMRGASLLSRTRPQFGRTLSLTTLLIAGLLLQACGGGKSSDTQGAGPMVAIAITPTNTLLPLGGVRQLTATGTLANGNQLDITSQVTWSTQVQQGSTGVLTVTPAGLASGTSLGSGVVSASLGPVVGVLPLVVSTNGYTSNTAGILAVPFKTTTIDAVYLPISQFQTAGSYSVQEINLDGDKFSSTIPVQTALLASISMPTGFVPNATAASQSSFLVAVISYNSPDIVVIDASNLSTDLLSNTIIATYTAPVTKRVSFQGKQCMICAVVVNPANDTLVLSTAQGYYSMNWTTGAFMALPFTPPALPAPSFLLNPVANDPYILSPTFGQDPNFASEVQTIDLKTNGVTSNTSLGLTAPSIVTMDLFDNAGVIVDAGANSQALLDLTNPLQPASTLVPDLSLCATSPSNAGFDMAAVGVAASVSPGNVIPTLFLSQHSSNCVGFELWPTSSSQQPLNPSIINYGYGSLPPTPDTNPFENGSDPNSIWTFNSVVDKTNYGVLVNAKQTWIAKINIGAVNSLANGFFGFFLPTGENIQVLQTGVGGDPVIYLPTTGTFFTSTDNVNFGNQAVGTKSNPSQIILTNAGTLPVLPQIAIQGTNAGDFTQSNNCATPLGAQGTCTISVVFTPGAQGQRSGTLNITGSGATPLTVALTGTGT